MVKKRTLSENGKIVVETAVIFPIVFLAVITVLYICIILFERAYMQSLADLAAQRGAVIWNNQEKDMFIGIVSKEKMKKGGLYWQFIDFKQRQKTEKVKAFILGRFSQHKLIIPAGTPEVSVKVENIFSRYKLVVTLDRKYKIPPGRLLKMFGITPYYTISAKAEAVIDQPAEFIRSTDLVLDIEKDLEDKYPEYGKIIRKVRENMKEVQTDIAGYFAGDE